GNDDGCSTDPRDARKRALRRRSRGGGSVLRGHAGTRGRGPPARPACLLPRRALDPPGLRSLGDRTPGRAWGAPARPGPRREGTRSLLPLRRRRGARRVARAPRGGRRRDRGRLPLAERRAVDLCPRSGGQFARIRRARALGLSRQPGSLSVRKASATDRPSGAMPWPAPFITWPYVSNPASVSARPAAAISAKGTIWS